MEDNNRPTRHWLMRQGQSLAMARQADHSVARLIHYDLAGRYGVRAHHAPARVRVQVPTLD